MVGQYIDCANPVSDHPLNRSLTNWWIPVPTNSGGSRLFDLRGGAAGTLTDGPTWMAPVSGFGAINFDGSDDHVSTTSGSVPETAAWTLVASCRFSSVSGAQAVAMHANSSSASSWSTALGIRSGVIDGYWYYGSTAHATGTTSLSAGVDYHLTFTGDSTANVFKVYLNGKDDTSGSPTGGAPSAAVNQLYLAATTGPFAGHDFTTRFGGIVRSVRRHNSALSASEVFALYDQWLRGYPDTIRRFDRTLYWFGPLAVAGGYVPPRRSSLRTLTRM